jgi:hypothetical protein
MKKALVPVMVVLLTIVFAGTALAQASPAAPEKTKAGALFSGPVTRVNMEMQTLSVKGRIATVTFDVSRPVFKGYKVLEEVKSGHMVGVQYLKDSTKVEKLATKAKAPAAIKEKAKEAEKKPSQKE